jgi:hypothetical protein
MRADQAWQNFNLGKELSISGAFIYNGLRRFYEMRSVDYTDEIFEFFYNLSVGFERLLKIAVILLEYKDITDNEAFEKSIITHNHLELLKRINKKSKINFGSVHTEFLSILASFYKTIRYDRFMISSIYSPEKERESLYGFLNKHLQEEIDSSKDLFGNQNKARYRNFIRKTVLKISNEIYELVQDTASNLNIYTYELRSGSRAETVFLGEADIPAEEVLWKELLIFFMNTKYSSGLLDFLRSIEPLEFDPGLADEYLDCFKSDSAKAMILGELEVLYEDLEDQGERLKLMELVANPNVIFDFEESDDN